MPPISPSLQLEDQRRATMTRELAEQPKMGTSAAGAPNNFLVPLKGTY